MITMMWQRARGQQRRCADYEHKQSAQGCTNIVSPSMIVHLSPSNYICNIYRTGRTGHALRTACLVGFEPTPVLDKFTEQTPHKDASPLEPQGCAPYSPKHTDTAATKALLCRLACSQPVTVQDISQNIRMSVIERQTIAVQCVPCAETCPTSTCSLPTKPTTQQKAAITYTKNGLWEPHRFPCQALLRQHWRRGVTSWLCIASTHTFQAASNMVQVLLVHGMPWRACTTHCIAGHSMVQHARHLTWPRPQASHKSAQPQGAPHHVTAQTQHRPRVCEVANVCAAQHKPRLKVQNRVLLDWQRHKRLYESLQMYPLHTDSPPNLTVDVRCTAVTASQAVWLVQLASMLHVTGPPALAGTAICVKRVPRLIVHCSHKTPATRGSSARVFPVLAK